MSVFLSVKGKLYDTYDEFDAKDHIKEHKKKFAHYKKVQIGDPLVIRYLFFYLKPEKNIIENTNEIMISTSIKTIEEKQIAAEAINYYGEDLKFENKILEISDFGGEKYGHELCYYTKSYLGESIRLTTKIQEINKPDKKVFDIIKKGFNLFEGIPALTQLLPYSGLAEKGLNFVESLCEIFRPDKKILCQDLDLHYQRLNSRKLQSGRIVCIPEEHNAENLINNYRLRADNRLVSIPQKSNEREDAYKEHSYFVLQINNEENKLYENFDYYQNIASLLDHDSQKGNHLVNNLMEAIQAQKDFSSGKRIDNLLLKDTTEETLSQIKALYNSMSSDMQKLYHPIIQELNHTDSKCEKDEY